MKLLILSIAALSTGRLLSSESVSGTYNDAISALVPANPEAWRTVGDGGRISGVS
ncbi:hypothetical protein [Arthrobacter sp. 08Y14]|uniref:hypothetical protein n=1 Tax=Arthrobacter sp. 08Y14 TaxID=2058885 RepID=UPI001CA56885|nr:hypothetical protein [Arthrobacter sp. 08Y14]